MVEIDQDLQALLEDLVRLAVLHVGDEADAAGIVLVRGIVEPLRARQQRVDPGQNRARTRACRGGALFRGRWRWVPRFWRSFFRSPKGSRFP